MYGHTNSDISQKLGIYSNTVSKWIKRSEQQKNNEDDILKQKIGYGRPSQINNDIRLLVLTILDTNKYLSLNELHTLINKNTKITKYKIHQILMANGYVYGFPPTTFPLTEEHKMKSLEFAIKYQNFDWTKVIFFDETSYWTNNGLAKRLYNINNIYNKDINYKHSSKIHIWGAISYENKIVDTFTENMNTVKYVDLLETKLMKIYVNDYYILGDNDPKHNSAKAKHFLKNKSVKYIDFPPCSPDPILMF